MSGRLHNHGWNPVRIEVPGYAIEDYLKGNPDIMSKLVDAVIKLHPDLVEDIVDEDREYYEEWIANRWGDIF